MLSNWKLTAQMDAAVLVPCDIIEDESSGALISRTTVLHQWKLNL